jgi:hypothetical protein
LALGAVASVGWSLAASAQQTDVNVFDNDGNLIAGNVTAFDWAEFGSGVSKGVGPFGTPLEIGQNFEFLYQSNLVNLDGDVPAGLVTTANGGALGGNNNVQYTIVSRLQETVTDFSAVGNVQTAVFTPTSGTISIFYDDGALANTQANRLAGTGFDDGTEVARFTLTGGVSNFTAVIDATPSGSGSASLDFDVLAALDFVDPAFLQGILGSVLDLHFDSNLNFPPGTSLANAFHIGGSGFYPDYFVQGDDIVFKVDGSNTFTTRQVPEPATLGLLGAGLVGLCLAFRRRSAAA